LTGLLIPALGIGSVKELMGQPGSEEVITGLEYPAYLSPFLAVARILALAVILMPNFVRLKEWAYAGLVFHVVGAIYSQLAVGNPIMFAVILTITLGIIFGSYYCYHSRRGILEPKVKSQEPES
jgi:hypothetical protein